MLRVIVILAALIGAGIAIKVVHDVRAKGATKDPTRLELVYSRAIDGICFTIVRDRVTGVEVLCAYHGGMVILPPAPKPTAEATP